MRKGLRSAQRVRTGGLRTQQHLSQGFQVGSNLDRKAQLVTSLEKLPSVFFPDSFLVLLWPRYPHATRTGHAMADVGDTYPVRRVEQLLCDTPHSVTTYEQSLIPGSHQALSLRNLDPTPSESNHCPAPSFESWKRALFCGSEIDKS